jgi:hypothetical protein
VISTKARVDCSIIDVSDVIVCKFAKKEAYAVIGDGNDDFFFQPGTPACFGSMFHLYQNCTTVGPQTGQRIKYGDHIPDVCTLRDYRRSRLPMVEE